MGFRVSGVIRKMGFIGFRVYRVYRAYRDLGFRVSGFSPSRPLGALEPLHSGKIRFAAVLAVACLIQLVRFKVHFLKNLIQLFPFKILFS